MNNLVFFLSPFLPTSYICNQIGVSHSGMALCVGFAELALYNEMLIMTSNTLQKHYFLKPTYFLSLGLYCDPIYQSAVILSLSLLVTVLGLDSVLFSPTASQQEATEPGAFTASVPMTHRPKAEGSWFAPSDEASAPVFQFQVAKEQNHRKPSSCVPLRPSPSHLLAGSPYITLLPLHTLACCFPFRTGASSLLWFFLSLYSLCLKICSLMPSPVHHRVSGSLPCLS